MKTFKSLLCLAVSWGCLIGGANAATLKIDDGSAQAGTEKNEIKISLTDEDLIDYNKVEFQLSISNTFYAQVTNVQPSTGAGLTFSPVYSGDIVTYTFTAEGDSTLSEHELGTIVYRTSESMDSDVRITPVNVKFSKADGTEAIPGQSAGVKAIAGTVKYERPKSSEAILTGLTTTQGTLSPEFDPTVTEYKVQIKDTLNVIRFNAVPCQGATVTGDTTMRDLKMGETTGEITVTAEDGSTSTTYKITVIRGEITEPSAYLKDLIINNIGASLSPTFDSKNNKYTVHIGEDITKLDFKYELEDPMAEVKIEGNEDFVEGENLVKITVESSDKEDKQVYEITVIKEEEQSNEPVDKDEPDEKDKKKTSVWLIVGIVVGILAIVGGVTFILFKKKKDAKKKEEDAKLPLKRREGTEKTVEIDRVIERPKHAAPETEEQQEKREYPTEEESITEILKTELYEDDRTQRFDSDEFKDLKKKIYDEDDDEETKEFNFKDFN